MVDATSVLLSIAMAIGPVVGYVDQYFMIRRKQSSAGFNSITCAILLFANILRIFFWFGKRFDVTLLIQSIIMIIAQLLLLEIVVRYRHDPAPSALYSNIQASFSSSSIDDELRAEEEGADYRPDRCWHPGRFWLWDRYLDYINCLLLVTTVLAVLYFFLRSHPVFFEILGTVSLGIESTLPLPQAFSNYKRRSTVGFSLLVLATWFLGDSFKLFYFIYTHAPLQFDICGAIQLSIDSVIVLQFILFSDRVKRWWRNQRSYRSASHRAGEPTLMGPEDDEY
ncbi:PQ loop repeat-domain-containing protein, partial [Radiomyces spectabilis]|uniref:PQ loop repeat-domain-containing protein n=1 Tax=Radiomyces spectabilis TaxID=64574 RepID=UPI00221FAF5E